MLPLFLLTLLLIALPTESRGNDVSHLIAEPATDESAMTPEPEHPAAVERLVFHSGQSLTGRSLAVEDGAVRWQLTVGEELLIPVERIARIEFAPGDWRLADSLDDNDDEGPLMLVSETVTALDEPQSGASLVVGGDSTAASGTAPPSRPVRDLDSSGPISNAPDHISNRWLHRFQLLNPLRESFGSLQQTTTTWMRRVQFGGTFVDGNSQTDLVDLAAEFERNTPQQLRQIDLGGQWARNRHRETANRWFINSNFDWPIREDDPWITFITSKNEYNGLQNLDYRGTVSTGLGYRFLFEPQRRLIARFGPAYTVEVFHDPERYRDSPDLFGEIEFRWPLFDRTSFEQRTRVQPSVLDFELVRISSTTGVLVDLDERSRWKLRLGLQYTYLSQPNPGRLPSDYITTVSLVYQRK